jgi:selenide,water dikinase
MELNDKAIEVFNKYKINSCTDVTGFGLIGHLTEMVKASNIQINIDTNQVPIFDQVIEYAEMGLYPEGGYSNRDNYQEMVNTKEGVDQNIEDILYDPQTSGGLLLSVSKKYSKKVLNMLHDLGVEDAAIIGEVKKGKEEIILR